MQHKVGLTVGALAAIMLLVVTIDGGAATLPINLEVNGTVYTIAQQPDGKILLGGDFKAVNGVLRDNLARINTDGTVDPAFTYGLYSNTANFMAIAISGSNIYIGGSFSYVGGRACSNLAKLNMADGSADPTWNGGADNNVNALIVQSDSVYIGGGFENVNGQAQKHIAKLSAVDGALDTGWCNGGANNSVGALASDGAALYAGGVIGTIGGQSRWGLVKLNLTDGAVDGSFTNIIGLPLDNSVSDILLADNYIYLAGGFTAIDGVAVSNLARIKLDTDAVDATWGVGANTNIGGYSLASDGAALYVGGYYGYGLGVAKLDLTHGAVMPGFSALGDIRDILINGTNLYVGGSFSRINDTVANAAAKLDPQTGAVQQNLVVMKAGGAGVLAELPDGKILIGGSFQYVNHQPRSGLARLNADWSLDSTFTNGVGGGVEAMVVKGTNIYIGGTFTNVFGLPRNKVAKLHADCTLDLAFTNGVLDNTAIPSASSVSSIAVDDTGLYLTGYPIWVTNSMGWDLVGLVKLNPDSGAVDGAFTNKLSEDGGYFGYGTESLILDGNNLYVSGSFTKVNGVPKLKIARFNLVSGNLDQSFDVSFADTVHSVAGPMQLVGQSLYVGGTFTNIAGRAWNGLAKLNVADGSADTQWTNPGGTNENVGIWNMKLVSADLYVGGQFSSLGGVALSYLAKLSTDGTVDTTFDNGGFNNYVSGIMALDTNVFYNLAGELSSKRNNPKAFNDQDGVLFISGEFTSARDTVALGCAILGDFAPQILTNPVTQAKNIGGTVTFSVAAESATPLMYQWLKDEASLTDDAQITGSLTNALTIADLQFADAGGYSCLVSNAYGVVTSLVATLTVNNVPVTGDIDGDRLADLITIVGSNWYVWFSTSGYQIRGGPYNFDIAGTPVTGDIDGDRLADLISVVGSNWYVWFSTSGYQVRGGPYNFDIAGAPVTGDIDGDRLADLITVVGSNWYVWFSTSGYQVRGGPYDMGISGIPATGDIDGDGLSDLISVVCANWYVWFSTSQYQVRGGPYTLTVP